MIAAKIKALALLAGLEYSECHELPNGYDHDRADPWLLFVCELGTFTIGWRKRVLSVEWTMVDAEPIADPALKWISHGSRYFHAWDWRQALVFLTDVVAQRRMDNQSISSDDGGAA